MASGTIPQTWANGGTGYCKLPNGTLIQWGTTFTPSLSTAQIQSSGIYYAATAITFPIEFYNSEYSISGMARYSTGYSVPIGAYENTRSTATVHLYDFVSRSNVSYRIEWHAIGIWK